MEGFVLGGSLAQIRNYPHSVYLNLLCNASFICGGSVLNQLVVLTAAHCLEECRRPRSDDVLIKYGHEKLDKMWSTRMKGFVIHEYYNDDLMENDIALVTSVRALPLGLVVQRVVLVQQTPNIKLGFMAGWGVMNANKDVSRALLDVVQELQPPKVCRLVGPVPRGAFCAGPISGTGTPDLGDSGSALMVKRYIQIGLVSYKEIKSTGTLLLKHAKQTIMSRTVCAKALGERLDNRLLCAGSWRGNDYAAAGDSGSALMIKGYIQIGLVSHKYSRISRSIVLYTNVSYHYDWIVKNTERLYCYSQLKNKL